MGYKNKLAALIAAHNDDYALDIMLESLHSHVDEVLILEDHSTDNTWRVAEKWARKADAVRHPVRNDQMKQKPLYFLRNWLLVASNARHVLCLDSDQVLVERNVGEIHGWVADDDVTAVGLRQVQLWGDFAHVARRDHFDRSHCYIDRAANPHFHWQQTDSGFLRSGVPLEQSESTLFFHINGVRPDRRLVSRLKDRKFFTGKLEESPAEIVREMRREAVHEAAMKRMRRMWNKGRMQMEYVLESGVVTDPGLCALPAVIQRRLPGRFEVVYEDGKPVERIDHWEDAG